MTKRNRWATAVLEDYLVQLLIAADGNVAKAAREAKIPERSLWNWVNRIPALKALEQRLKAERRKKSTPGL